MLFLLSKKADKGRKPKLEQCSSQLCVCSVCVVYVCVCVIIWHHFGCCLFDLKQSKVGGGRSLSIVYFSQFHKP